MRKNNGVIMFQFIVNVFSLVAFIIQLSPIPEKYSCINIGLVYIVLALVTISLIISIVSRNKYSRKRLLKMTTKHMRNARDNVTMFGGDLSWANDYKDVIQRITANGKNVQIVFPMTKIASMTVEAKNIFEQNVDILKKAGAKIFYTKEEHALRCTIIDSNAFELNSIENDEDLKIITSKRVFAHKNDDKKNKYRASCYSTKKEHEKSLCVLYCKYYNEIKEKMLEY